MGNFRDLPNFKRNNHNKHRMKDSYNKTENANSMFRQKENLYSEDILIFDWYLIDLYNFTILTDDMHGLTVEQQRFFEKYLYEGGLKTDDDSYQLTELINQLNTFLGTHRGDSYNGRKRTFKDRTVKRLYSSR